MEGVEEAVVVVERGAAAEESAAIAVVVLEMENAVVDWAEGGVTEVGLATVR